MTETVEPLEDARDGYPLEYEWYDESHGCVYVADDNGHIWRQEFVITDEKKQFSSEEEFYNWWNEQSEQR